MKFVTWKTTVHSTVLGFNILKCTANNFFENKSSLQITKLACLFYQGTVIQSKITQTTAIDIS